MSPLLIRWRGSSAATTLQRGLSRMRRCGALFAAAWIVSHTPLALGCECMFNPEDLSDPVTELRSHPLVVVASVVGVDRSRGCGCNDTGVVATMRVEEAFKGAVVDEKKER